MNRNTRPRDKHLTSLHLRNFFLSYLMVALPVLMITNLLFYMLFVPRYQEEVLQINSETVKGIRLGFEHYVTSPIERVYLNLIYESSVDITYPLRGLRRDDTWLLYQTHQYMKKLVDGSDGLLKRMDIYYHDVSFINGSDGYLTADNTDCLFYPGWVDLIDLSRETQWARNTEHRRYSVVTPTTENVVYYYRTFPSNNLRNRQMTFVFTITEKALNEILLDQIGFQEYQFTVISADGEVLISANGDAPDFRSIAHALPESPDDTRILRANGQLITLLSSQHGDLYFVFSIPEAFYFKGTNQIKWTILIVTSLALLSILILSRIISRRMFSPIAVMNQTATNALNAMGVSSSNQDDSFTTIHEALNVLTTRVQDMDKQMEAYLPRLRTHFYRDVLLSGQLGNFDIEERMTALNIRVYPFYRVMKVCFSENAHAPAIIEMYRMKVYEFLKALDSPDFGTFVTLQGEDAIISVLSYMEEDDVDGLLHDLYSKLVDADNAVVLARIALGGRQQDIYGIRESLHEAEQVINYGFLFPSRVLRYENFADWEKTESLLECVNSDRIFALVTSLTEPNATNAVEDFLKELRTQVYAQPFSSKYLRFALLRMCASIMETFSKRDAYIDRIYEKNTLEKLEHTQTFDEFENTLRCILAELAQRIQLKRDNANYDTVTMVQRYVQEHLQEQLSLHRVSEHFHISYSHMSKVFKEISGMNFSEYVLECRLEESLHLLVDSNLNLDAIAEKVGIGNAGYYIRTFKSKYGVTPKQYRLSHVSI